MCFFATTGIGWGKREYFYHLGSSSFITDLNGNGIQHLQYLPFGESFVDQQIGQWNTPYKFSGKEKDDETGYSYFGARYYDSDLSVWLSVDPMADKYPSLSPFMYCKGNPVMMIDEFGEYPRDRFNDGDRQNDGLKGLWRIFRASFASNHQIRIHPSYCPDKCPKINYDPFLAKTIGTLPPKLANFDANGQFSQTQTPPEVQRNSPNTGGGPALDCWPYVVVSINSGDNKLDATRIGGWGENTNGTYSPKFTGGPYDGQEIRMDGNGNILNPNDGSILYQKPNAIAPFRDQILSREDAQGVMGVTGEGGGARIFSGTYESGGTDKTQQVIDNILNQ